jgi:leucyl aminopeptidase
MTTFKVPRVRYRKSAELAADLARYQHIALIVRKAADLAHAPFADILQKRLKAQGVTVKPGAVFLTEAPDEHGTTLAVGFADDTMDTFAYLELARKLSRFRPGVTRIALLAPGLKGSAQREALRALVRCLYAQAPLPSRQTGRTVNLPAAADVYGPGEDDHALRAAAYGNHLARALSVLPENELGPADYVKHVKKLAAENGWRFRFLDERRLAALGAGAFLAVTRTRAAGAGIVHLRYTPRKALRPPVALVGKGICYDTGGVNLKPPRHMYGMHEDMMGSAVALGTLHALAQSHAPFRIDCYLAIAENAIGPLSYRPNEVVRAVDGTTIEVVHTDAEGRMVLADTLALATRERPGLIIDYATLTGACVYALGTRMTGVFTNRPELTLRLIEAGRASGERVWPFPLAEDYEADLKSDIADIKQCTLEGEADHILAALFLKRFIAHDPTWIHLDLSAGRHKGGLGAIPTDTTGFGVDFTLALLADPAFAW